MRIAVTYDNGEVFQHFGRTEAFKVYEVEGGRVISSRFTRSVGSGSTPTHSDACWGRKVWAVISGTSWIWSCWRKSRNTKRSERRRPMPRGRDN